MNPKTPAAKYRSLRQLIAIELLALTEQPSIVRTVWRTEA
jgi:hypothetical protein